MTTGRSRWLPGLRAVLALAREIRALRTAVERIADVLEGRPPTVSLPDAPNDLDARVIHTPNDQEIVAAWEAEEQLRGLLGRDPDPEEVVRVLDGEEWTAEDAAGHRRKVLAALGREEAGRGA